MPQFVLNMERAADVRASAIASLWHSVNTWSDPGVAMYSVTSTARIHNKAHRRDVVRYIDDRCLPHAETFEDATDLLWLRNWALRYPIGPSVAERFERLPEFVRGYIECAFFDGVERQKSDPDYSDSDPKDTDASVADLAPSTLAEMIAECRRFRAMHGKLLRRAVAQPGYSWERAGHDFWYTRNGHGVGFWCRDELKRSGLDRKLSELVGFKTEFTDCFLYRGDDGLIYCS